jgi:monomeric isocitrate dehydrogenase
MSPVDAMNHSLKRGKEGKDAISATGNVLRDYLTPFADSLIVL